MKRTILLALAFTLTLFLPARLAGQLRVERLTVTPGGEVSFDARISPQATRRSYKLILTPVLTDGEHTAELPPIIVETRRTRMLDARGGVTPPPDARLTENGAVFRYTATTTSAAWLADAGLRFEAVSEGCCSEELLDPVVITRQRGEALSLPASLPAPLPPTDPNQLAIRVGDRVMILTRYAAPAPVSRPDVITENVDTMQALMNKLQIGFAQGSSRLEAGAFGNYRALNEVISLLRSSQDIVLQGRIEITGKASPEGTEMGNYLLAENRAMAVRNYLLDHVHWLRPAHFDIVNGGENWEGLYELVQAAPMPGRWQVLEILDNTAAEIGYSGTGSRKQLLMKLDGGRTWRYMLDHFFPRLRNAASITIYAPIERSTVRTPSPVQPVQDHTDRINRAIDLLGERRLDEAIALLTPLLDDPRTWNPMGVARLLQGDPAQAAEYFRRGAEAGYAEAGTNLQQME